jgi:hypothetical protein
MKLCGQLYFPAIFNFGPFQPSIFEIVVGGVSANEIASMRWLRFYHCECPSDPFISQGPPWEALGFLSNLNER